MPGTKVCLACNCKRVVSTAIPSELDLVTNLPLPPSCPAAMQDEETTS
jgi:hypothetical protein